MLEHIVEPSATSFPGRPVRVLIEDRWLAADAFTSPSSAVEVTLCSGPGDGEECPLVMDGACPLGTFDVVVSSLDGPWAPAIRAAWAETGTPYIDAVPVDPSADSLAAPVGAALHRLWEPYRSP